MMKLSFALHLRCSSALPQAQPCATSGSDSRSDIATNAYVTGASASFRASVVICIRQLRGPVSTSIDGGRLRMEHVVDVARSPAPATMSSSTARASSLAPRSPSCARPPSPGSPSKGATPGPIPAGPATRHREMRRRGVGARSMVVRPTRTRRTAIDVVEPVCGRAGRRCRRRSIALAVQHPDLRFRPPLVCAARPRRAQAPRSSTRNHERSTGFAPVVVLPSTASADRRRLRCIQARRSDGRTKLRDPFGVGTADGLALRPAAASCSSANTRTVSSSR